MSRDHWMDLLVEERRARAAAEEERDRLRAELDATKLTDDDREVLTEWRRQHASYMDTSLRLGVAPSQVVLKRLAILDRLIGGGR